jgi:hypothetical protein
MSQQRPAVGFVLMHGLCKEPGGCLHVAYTEFSVRLLRKRFRASICSLAWACHACPGLRLWRRSSLARSGYTGRCGSEGHNVHGGARLSGGVSLQIPKIRGGGGRELSRWRGRRLDALEDEA